MNAIHASTLYQNTIEMPRIAAGVAPGSERRVQAAGAARTTFARIDPALRRRAVQRVARASAVLGFVRHVLLGQVDVQRRLGGRSLGAWFVRGASDRPLPRIVETRRV